MVTTETVHGPGPGEAIRELKNRRTTEGFEVGLKDANGNKNKGPVHFSVTALDVPACKEDRTMFDQDKEPHQLQQVSRPEVNEVSAGPWIEVCLDADLLDDSASSEIFEAFFGKH